MKKLSIIVFLFSLHYTYSQNNSINTITTAVPFLLINPNSQSMGMADIGVVAASGYYESGLTQNPALLSRNEKVIGGKVSYKPWLRQLVPDINTYDANFYYAFSKKSALGISYNLFSLGDIMFIDINGNTIGQYRPVENCYKLNFAQSITPNFSIGLGTKLIRSDLTGGTYINGQATHIGIAIAADLGIDYRKEIAKKEKSFWRYDLGASIVNMGNKIRYSDVGKGDFIPMQLALGTMWTYNWDISPHLRYCIDFAYQLEKLLVPTPPLYAIDSTGQLVSDGNGGYQIVSGKNPDVSVFKGAYQSFYDAPGGTKEEMREIIHKFGIENRMIFNENSSVAIRLGYFNESKYKGNRKYLTMGMGGKFMGFYLDAGINLLYKGSYGGFYGGQYQEFIVYQSDIINFSSWNFTLGYKYTFKEKEVEKKDIAPNQ